MCETGIKEKVMASLEDRSDPEGPREDRLRSRRLQQWMAGVHRTGFSRGVMWTNLHGGHFAIWLFGNQSLSSNQS